MENNLLFDLSATQPSPEAKYHGGGDYAKFVFFEAIKRGMANFSGVYNPDRQIDNKIISLCKENNIKLYKATCKDELVHIIHQNRFNKFYSALPYLYGNLNSEKVEFIMTIHGLRSLELPSDKYEIKYRTSFVLKIRLVLKNLLFPKRNIRLSYRNFSELLRNKNKTIITVSTHTKYSLLSYFSDLNPSQIKILYSPLELSKQEHNESRENYYLLLNANRWEKNSYRAICAFDQLFSEGHLKDKTVVVLGASQDYKIFKIANKDRFIFKDYLPEEEFAKYFQNAFCLVYPTLNEGFGYPPLIAMKYGIPAIVSAITSTTEVCDNAVLYFNPYSIGEIKNRILQVYFDDNLVDKIRILGYNRISILKDRINNDLNELFRLIFS